MSITHIDGLPAHVLFVHFVVVLVPLTAVAAVAGAVRLRYARRMGLALPLLGLVTLGLVPLTTHAGEWLRDHVGNDPLISKHAELGDGLLPWATVLFVATVVVWWLGRVTAAAAAGTAAEGTGEGTATAGPRWVSSKAVHITAIVLAATVSAGAVVTVYRIGESGAKAAWHGTYTQSSTGDHGDDG